MLGSDHSQERPNSLGGLTLSANNLPHILWVNVKRNQYAHFINHALGAYVIGVVYQRPYNELHKRCILFFCCHICLKLLYILPLAFDLSYKASFTKSLQADPPNVN
jgi:hypothetical protein